MIIEGTCHRYLNAERLHCELVAVACVIGEKLNLYHNLLSTLWEFATSPLSAGSRATVLVGIRLVGLVLGPHSLPRTSIV